MASNLEAAKKLLTAMELSEQKSKGSLRTKSADRSSAKVCGSDNRNSQKQLA